jgi:DNA-binding response OmpR family regulator
MPDTILIVDDEESNIRLLTRILGKAGFANVHGTQDPLRILETYRALSPDLIVLDVHMPGLDGFGVLKQLATVLTAAEFLPVLAVTGDLTPETRERILVAGAKDFLAKPFEPSEVVARIQNLLRMRALHASLREFLERMTHEMRTPLNAVIGFAKQLEKNRANHLDASELEYVRRIVDNGTGLLHVIEDILERSRLESERLADERQR